MPWGFCAIRTKGAFRVLMSHRIDLRHTGVGMYVYRDTKRMHMDF